MWSKCNQNGAKIDARTHDAFHDDGRPFNGDLNYYLVDNALVDALVNTTRMFHGMNARNSIEVVDIKSAVYTFRILFSGARWTDLQWMEDRKGLSFLIKV